ncbi:plasma membrane fusion protein prm1 [Rhizina undulata]
MASQNYPVEAPRYEDAIAEYNVRSVPTTDPELTPYLGLRARLSQVWFNRWTVLLLLVMVRILIASESLNNDLGSARTQALSACTGVESMGSAMASMPYYMASGVNELAAKGIEKSVQTLEDTLLLLITAIQEVVVFWVNMMTSTYVCLFTLAVKGSLDAVLNATAKIADWVNGTLNTIFDDVEKDASSLQDLINSAASKIAAIPNFFGADVTFPTVTLPSLDALKNVTIPSELDAKLLAIESNIPTFSEVKTAADNVIRLPFQAIEKLVNESLTTFTFNRSLFPVPEKETLTFCSDNPSINNFFDNLLVIILKVKKILVGVLIVLAILAMIPMGYREWWNWRSTRNRANLISAPGRQFDPIDIVTITTRPFSSTVGLKLADRFESPRRQILVRWAVAYMTTTPALLLLSLGVAGLLSALAQYVLLKQVEVATPALAAEVGQFAELVVNKLENASEAWAVGTNSVINKTNTDLNNELFGWVKNGTDALNDTLNTFVDTMHDSIEVAFGGTILATAINDVLNCLITLKIQGIQNGLTWVNEHAEITLPTLPNNTFSLGASQSIGSNANVSSFLSDTADDTSDKITEVVFKFTQKWSSALRQEAIIAGCITAVWFIVLLIAIIRTLVMFSRTGKVRGVGGDVVTASPPGGGGTGMRSNNPFDDRNRIITGGYGYGGQPGYLGADSFPRFEGSSVGSGEQLPSPDYSEKDLGWINVGIVDGQGKGVVHHQGEEAWRNSVYPSFYEKR